MNDIKDKNDVKIFVDAFYAQIRQDEALAPIFNSKISEERWPMHLERMYSFWNTVLFAAKDYHGNPFSKHANLPVDNQHFEQWVKLFVATIDNNFRGDKAEEVKDRASKMSQMFASKIAYLNANKQFKNIM